MMMLNRGLRIARTGVRHMSHGTEAEAKEQMIRWKQISMGAMGFMGLLTVYTTIQHFSHKEHEHEHPPFAYLKLRNKPFPWHYSGCDFLDSHCKELARAAEQALNEE